MFETPDMDTARELLGGIIADFAARAPKAIDRLEEGFDDAMAVMVTPMPPEKAENNQLCREAQRRDPKAGTGDKDIPKR